MIFNLYQRFAVRLGGDKPEEYVFDRGRLMFTEVAEIEKVTGLSYGEWQQELGRYSISAVAALLHVLRKRAGQPSDFAAMQFNAADLDVVPLRDDGTELTAEDVAADLARRMAAAEEKANPPTPGEAVAGELIPAPVMSGTSPASPNGSTSAHGNGTSSPGVTSASSRPKRTPG